MTASFCSTPNRIAVGTAILELVNTQQQCLLPVFVVRAALAVLVLLPAGYVYTSTTLQQSVCAFTYVQAGGY